ncbi:hypothetical protein J4T99_gp086 [Mycobacterium phage Bromden]|uniref:Uncharacterized protein n=1 Tax=Mycobacterium phage Bromden TaxID=2283252 RepID=A0A345MBM0_9CAUD|nr:hypothetical protein J4T99_gp086 [Mycobacterium phage Bromden]AXH67891.1 hypothetical protein SEA_BROMDEN_86 [Mycobacterium phage Bromden]
MRERWGVRYPISGVHTCPFGRKQADMIHLLALMNGVTEAVVVVDDGDGWRVV